MRTFKSIKKEPPETTERMSFARLNFDFPKRPFRIENILSLTEDPRLRRASSARNNLLTISVVSLKLDSYMQFSLFVGFTIKNVAIY